MPLNHAHYLGLAYKIATHSPDPRTQIGAILVDPISKEIKSQGCNRPPFGISCQGYETSPRLHHPLKNQFIEHAEKNVIYEAARSGVKTEGLIMYCPWSCLDCARAIIQAGIIAVVGHDIEIYKTNERWNESIQVANDILDEAGVIRHYYQGHLGKKIRFNGEYVEV